MSAWVVSTHHINALLHAGLYLSNQQCQGSKLVWRCGDEEETTIANGLRYVLGDTYRELTYDNASLVGAILLAQNIRSVNHRYNEDDLEPIYEYRQPPGRPDPLITLKLICCLRCQSNETSDYEDTEAYRFTEALQDVAIGLLPGFDEAPWGVNDTNVWQKATTR
jgi:hypothetical protein